MSKFIGSTTLRSNLSSVLKTVATKEDYLVVTRKGSPTSALVNLDFFEDLLALASPKYLKSIEEARRDYKKGQVARHEEIFGEL